ncbi:MAG: hypothetical protein GF350_01545, partial [Chitinivibrionales bacterium]|nr:hypothetical protein [Chitinivibrionales bacterium]
LFLVETESRARSRGDTIIAEIVGAGSAYDPMQTKEKKYAGNSGAVHVIRHACENAGIAPSDISCVAASANGNPGLDSVEASAITELCPDVPVTVYKNKTGECYGASPAVSAVCALIDMKQSRISGNKADYAVINDLNIVREDKQGVNTEFLLINAFSCEGNCSSIILKNYTG